MEIFDEERTEGSAGTVTRALKQIETYGLSHQLSGSLKHAGIPIHRQVSDLSPYQNPSALERYHEQRQSPRRQQQPREVLNMATVNIMSGAVTLEDSTRHSPNGMRKHDNSPFLANSPQLNSPK